MLSSVASIVVGAALLIWRTYRKERVAAGRGAAYAPEGRIRWNPSDVSEHGAQN